MENCNDILAIAVTGWVMAFLFALALFVHLKLGGKNSGDQDTVRPEDIESSWDEWTVISIGSEDDFDVSSDRQEDN